MTSVCVSAAHCGKGVRRRGLLSTGNDLQRKKALCARVREKGGEERCAAPQQERAVQRTLATPPTAASGEAMRRGGQLRSSPGVLPAAYRATLPLEPPAACTQARITRKLSA